MKRIIIILCTMFFSIGMGACMPELVEDSLLELLSKAAMAERAMGENPAEVARDRALEYLNENYDDTFTAVSYSSGGLMYSHATVVFESEKYEGATVEVRIYENEDGGYTFAEDYYHCYMQDEAVAYFTELLDVDIPAAVKVRFPAYVWSDELNGASTFAEWIQNGNCDMDVFYITNQEVPDEKKNAMVEQIAKDKIIGSVYFYSTTDESLLSDKTVSEVVNNRYKWTNSISEFYINPDFSIESVEQS